MQRLDLNPEICGKAVKEGEAVSTHTMLHLLVMSGLILTDCVLLQSGFLELSRRMLMVDEARRGAATIESDAKPAPKQPPEKKSTSGNKTRKKGPAGKKKMTILHKNPEEEDAAGLYSNLRNADEIGQGHANVKLVHIERSIPPLFNSLLGFFVTFFDIGSTKPGAGGYAALNPYYFLFSAALLRPGYLPLWMGFATTRSDPMEVGLAAGRLSWLVFGADRLKRFLANTLTPPYLQRYADLRASVQEVPKENICSIRYEQLLTKPAETLRTLASFLGIDPAFNVDEVVPSPRETPILLEVAAALAVPTTAELVDSLNKEA